MDNATFFDELSGLSGYKKKTKAGFEIILSEALKRRTPTNFLAYILATAWWETGRSMLPVREAFYISKSFAVAEKWRRKNLRYYPYYGRGYVQLTWEYNYRKAGEKLGYGDRFVKDPDMVMDEQIAVQILFQGMEDGWFTGKRLQDFIDDIDESNVEDGREYYSARRVVNGLDRAAEIRNLALFFEKAMRKSGYSIETTGQTGPSPQVPPDVSFDQFIASLGLKHFKPYEFLVKGPSHTNPKSPAYGLNTDPPRDLWGNIALAAKVLDRLRVELARPIILLSVYRSADYNRAIGGTPQSRHMQFDAIDFAVKGSPVGPIEWANVLKRYRSSGVFSGGIGIYSTFVHVDTRGNTDGDLSKNPNW